MMQTKQVRNVNGWRKNPKHSMKTEKAPQSFFALSILQIFDSLLHLGADIKCTNTNDSHSNASCSSVLHFQSASSTLWPLV